MTTTCDIPENQLLLRTLAMPSDTNANGDIFGGWIMAQMDIAGGILAKEIIRGRCATVGVEAIKFLKPVQVGDIVCCYGKLERIGNTSLTLCLEIWVKPILRETEESCPRFKVTEAHFTYVAIDEDGNKRVIDKSAGST